MPRSGTGSAYEDIDEVRDADGVVAVISERKKGGILSVAFFKEFDREGSTERSAFLQRRHLDGVERMLPIIREKLDAHLDRQKAADRAAARAATGGGRAGGQR